MSKHQILVDSGDIQRLRGSIDEEIHSENRVAVDANAIRKSVLDRHSKRLFGGSALKKKCRNARSHQRWVKISQDLSEFRWALSKSDMEDLKNPNYKSIPTRSISSVITPFNNFF